MADNYKQGLDRNQQLMFPLSLDEYVDENHPVRAVDSYVEMLDLSSLDFKNTRKSNRVDGQKAYHPKLLLKIYIYGYINKIRSSRALEKESKRNIELMWLTQGLSPSYRTISEFRAINFNGLKTVFREFVLLCKHIDLIGDGLKAVDGAFLRANASKNRLLTQKTLQQDLKQIDIDIKEYLTTLEYSDKEHPNPKLSIDKLPKNLEKLKVVKETLRTKLKFLESKGKTQLNTTDPDASLMIKPAHNLMAYNSQIVVDESFKFIVATDISSQGNDVQQLHTMSMQTKENLALTKDDNLEIVGDTGYYNSKELKKCTTDNINAIVPESNTKRVQKKKGYFTRDKFQYNEYNDCYICPMNQKLTKAPAPQIKNGKINFIYRGTSKICKSCPKKDLCIPIKSSYKQIYRWEHEYIVEAHRAKMQTQQAKDTVKKRGSIVEHPFGTIKRTLGWDHFLLRGKEKVSGENSLIMFSYNFKRLLNLIGISLFQQLMLVIKSNDAKQIEQIKQDIMEYILFYCQYIANLSIILVSQSKFKIRNLSEI